MKYLIIFLLISIAGCVKNVEQKNESNTYISYWNGTSECSEYHVIHVFKYSDISLGGFEQNTEINGGYQSKIHIENDTSIKTDWLPIKK
jgi:hypothetical protein